MILTVGLTSIAGAQERDRSAIPDRYKWNLQDLYASEPAWRTAKEKLVANIPQVKQYRGTLASSPQALLKALEALTALNKDVQRVYLYTALSSDLDTRVASTLALKQEVMQLYSTYSAEIAYFEPEILKMDQATIASFIAKEPGLATYAHYLNDIQRRKAHTLSEGEEKIIADAGLMSPAAGEVYGILTNADFPFPTITLADGTSLKLDPSAFSVSRSLPNREDRKKVFNAYFGELGKFRATLGATMNASVQSDLFFSRARKYPSTLESALDSNNIPVSVYRSLVDGVNANLPTFHRYLKLRQRMMGLDQLHYYDLYAPLVGDVDLTYTPEETQKNVVAALAPLGKDYTSVIEKAFNERWIDLFPSAGKTSGAYSNGAAYDTHPFMLVNYNGRYDDMSTVAHELGHTMQSYLSNQKQPFQNAGYPIFVAEVASTFNEALLIDHMLKSIKDPGTRLALLGNYLEGIKGTVFRQTQFAEFELRTHEMAERGEPLTGEALDKLYMDITKKYYGHDKGVAVVDDVIAHEWAYIPHFYSAYYVYQYATSFTASAALSEKVLAGDKVATKKYLDFLSAGGSKYPIDLLKDAGVDMTTTAPLELTMKKMNRIMDEMEASLAKMKK